MTDTDISQPEELEETETHQKEDQTMTDDTSSHCACRIIATIIGLFSITLIGASVWAGMNKRKEVKEITKILQSSTKDLSTDAKEKIADTVTQISEALTK